MGTSVAKSSARKAKAIERIASVAETICDRLAAGESLNAICKTDGMPSEPTVRRWAIEDFEGFATKYTRAREIQAHFLAEQIIAISDESSRDSYTDENGVERTNTEVVARSKLRVDSRKWFLSKVLPKVYGDKLEIGGTLGLKKAPTDLSDAELEAIIRAKKIDAQP